MLICIALAYLFYAQKKNVVTEITEEKVFVQNESLIVEEPLRGDIVTSPLTLKGKVRGTWLFEADAPVLLTDWDGRIIGESYIKADGNWMTEEFVPFTGTITFTTPQDVGEFSNRGSIVFMKANAADLPVHEEALEFEIFYW